ncbi:MAG: hypothetical protein JKY88_06715 [Pseudomonadales bacterium]|nr:hypothetical protein [Pseudomonadales bacterium]
MKKGDILATFLSMLFAFIFPVVIFLCVVLFLQAPSLSLLQKISFIQLCFTSFFSLLAVCVSFAAVYFSRVDREHDRNRSVTDEFWFRTLLMPKLHLALNELITKYQQLVEDYPAQIDLEEFEADTTRMRQAITQFALLNRKLVIDLELFLDRLEQYVSHRSLKAEGYDVSEMKKDEETELSFPAFVEVFLGLLYETHNSLSPK